MIHLPFGQQGSKLLPDRLDDVWWQGGHGFSPSSGSLVTPQMIERPAPAFQVDVLRPYPRSLLAYYFDYPETRRGAGLMTPPLLLVSFPRFNRARRKRWPLRPGRLAGR